jgi:hypothetical protein
MPSKSAPLLTTWTQRSAVAFGSHCAPHHTCTPCCPCRRARSGGSRRRGGRSLSCPQATSACSTATEGRYDYAAIGPVAILTSRLCDEASTARSSSAGARSPVSWIWSTRGHRGTHFERVCSSRCRLSVAQSQTVSVWRSRAEDRIRERYCGRSPILPAAHPKSLHRRLRPARADAARARHASAWLEEPSGIGSSERVLQ